MSEHQHSLQQGKDDKPQYQNLNGRQDAAEAWGKLALNRMYWVFWIFIVDVIKFVVKKIFKLESIISHYFVSLQVKILVRDYYQTGAPTPDRPGWKSQTPRFRSKFLRKNVIKKTWTGNRKAIFTASESQMATEPHFGRGSCYGMFMTAQYFWYFWKSVPQACLIAILTTTH